MLNIFVTCTLYSHTCRENKLKFDRMMEEADIAAKELMDLEHARNEKVCILTILYVL